MQRQPQDDLPLPTKVSHSPNAQPTVRFGEGFIAPKIAMHHSRENT